MKASRTRCEEVLGPIGGQREAPDDPLPDTPLPNPGAPLGIGFARRMLHTRRVLRSLRGWTPAADTWDARRDPLVSVVLITYNHGRYIADALESILAQTGGFRIEINVLDDASTDDTQRIVEQYAKRFPGVINCYFNAVNVGRKATQLNTYRGFQTVRGKYFALLEGDDYWTFSGKLAAQIRFLEDNPSFVACAHKTRKFFDDGSRPPEHFLPFESFRKNVAELSDLISLNAVYHISSTLYRNVFRQNPPLCLADPSSCEVTIQMVYGCFGNFYCFDEYWSAYRVHEQGVFSGRSRENIWLFHVRGFRRFALYLGPSNWVAFLLAIRGFTRHVLASQWTPEKVPLRPQAYFTFLAHFAAATALTPIVTLAQLPGVVFSRASRERAIARARASVRVLYDRAAVAVSPALRLRYLDWERRHPRVACLRSRLKSPSTATELVPIMNNSDQDKSFQIETTANSSQLQARERLVALFERSPIPLPERLFNIGMYTRSSVLVKYLVLNDIYQRIKNIPGHLMEFGTWWGQNLVLLENLRAIHEPFNKQRVIVGFDTFDGYTELSEKDKPSEVWAEQSYNTGVDYMAHLRELLQTHEASNALGHLTGRHQLIAGDVSQTAKRYFEENPATLVAMAYFDMALYQPTKDALVALRPHLVSGSVLLFDELTWPESPGEAIAFKEVFTRDEVTIEKCALYPSKAIVTVR